MTRLMRLENQNNRRAATTQYSNVIVNHGYNCMNGGHIVQVVSLGKKNVDCLLVYSDRIMNYNLYDWLTYQTKANPSESCSN